MSALPVDDRAWFERTGHCGQCGQPGTYCTCTDRRPCGCRDLHVMGSGLGADALDQFTLHADDDDDDDQQELF